MDQSVRLGSLTLKNPLITALGIFGYGLEFMRYGDLGSLGGICLKGISLTPRAGNGMPRIFPALNNNSAVYANNAQSVIQVTLEGGRMPHSKHDVMAFSMPGFKHLTDQDIADVVNFVRNSWHNQAPEISSRDVAEIRHFVNRKAPNIVPQAASGAHHE